MTQKRIIIVAIASLSLIVALLLLSKPIHTLTQNLSCNRECQINKKLELIVSLYIANLANPGCLPKDSFYFFNNSRPLHLSQKEGLQPVKTGNSNLLHFHIISGGEKYSFIIDTKNDRLYSGKMFEAEKKIPNLFVTEPTYLRDLVVKLESSLNDNYYKNVKKDIRFCSSE